MIALPSKSLLPVLALMLGLCRSLVAADEPAGDLQDPAEKLPAIGLKADPSAAPIIPWPMRGEAGGERIVLPPTARIVAATPELAPLAGILAGQIARLSGRQLPQATGAAAPGDILLRIAPGLTFADDPYLKLNPGLKGFEHRITASAKGCLIEGTDYKSTALATATLLQCLEGTEAALSYPPMRIEDKPGSTYCAVMLDVAREWFPAETLKDVIDLCQFYKIPYFHLHITDDQGYRLPSKAFPNLPSSKASYTEKELRDLVAYGDAHGVTLVPEMEMPGHSTPIQKVNPELFGARDDASGGKAKHLGVINMANPDVYPALEKLIVETCDIFKSSPYFHIGADETNFGQFNKNPYVQKQLVELESKEHVEKNRIFGYFLNRINAIVKKQGKQAICWEGFGGKQEVDKDMLVYAWHGSSNPPQNLLGDGYRIMNTPWTPSIYSTVRQNYEWNKWKLNLNENGVSRQFEADPKVVGGAMLLWQRGPDDALGLLRPKAPARHERLYSPYAKLGYDHFAKRLAHDDAVFERLVHPMSVRIEGLANTEENLATGPVKITAATPVKGAKIRYAFNEGTVTSGSPACTGTIEVSPGLSKRGKTKFYDGPSTQVRLRVFDSQDRPLGGEKIVEVRNDVPRIEYTLKDLPAGQDAFPGDTSKLTVVKSGRLATFDGTGRLAADSGPRLFEARATVEIRTAGSYDLVSRAHKKVKADTRIKFGDGPWLEPDAKGHLTTDLPAGTYPVVVQQLAPDGNIAVSFDFAKPPEDAGGPPRSPGNRALNYWMKPL